eukprot:TRINITY_DN3272_c0_g5_i4.p1 TRINITY_DN3272_c0_g5~~TRINITY_DN3272_c0_g5_i4.p1  ORF type:complete len:414 (+),score=123.34 TRINITY_DN3272_c0_g5_i4:121-1362(+)
MADWKKVIDINQVCEYKYSKCNIFFGVGAINKFEDILQRTGAKKVGFVASRGAYQKTGAWAILEKLLKEHNVEYKLYNKVTANPETVHVDEAREFFYGDNQWTPDFLCGIGGGSPIDACKALAITMKYPEQSCMDLFTFKFTPTESVPVVAINLTHGTGTESNRFAVVSVLVDENGQAMDIPFKPCIAYDISYPIYSIDDPALLVTLPGKQTLYTAVDALNHVTEACSTLLKTPFSINIAHEVVNYIVEYLPKAVADPEDLTARYWLLYASMLAGQAFDVSLLHLTHALEHTLSAYVPELPHALGLSMILPAVLKHCYDHNAEIFAYVYEKIIPNLEGKAGEGAMVAKKMEEWLVSVGITEKLKDFFTKEQVDTLVDSTHKTPGMDGLLALSPFEINDEILADIFESSFEYMP